MVKKNFIGVVTPCVATALFMSGIMFTGCSKDDDFEDWDEETVQTLAEQRMTRSAEGTTNLPKFYTSKDFTHMFHFQIEDDESPTLSGYLNLDFTVNIYKDINSTSDYKAKITVNNDSRCTMEATSCSRDGEEGPFHVYIKASFNDPATQKGGIDYYSVSI